jgi:hypothetical protein
VEHNYKWAISPNLLILNASAPRLGVYLSEEAVRSIARSYLNAAIVAGMLNLPAMAADPKPLGMVIQAQEARLSDAEAAMGATVYPGDTLATSIVGTLRRRVGLAQLYLLSSSAVTMTENDAAVRATVVRGTAGFSPRPLARFSLIRPSR